MPSTYSSLMTIYPLITPPLKIDIERIIKRSCFMKKLSTNKPINLIESYYELEKHLYSTQAGDILLGLIFIHFLNKHYKNYTAQISENHQENPNVSKKLFKLSTFYVPIKAQTNYLVSHRHNKFISHSLINAMKAIEIYNKPALQHIFKLAIDALNTLGNGYHQNKLLNKILTCVFSDHYDKNLTFSDAIVERLEQIQELAQNMSLHRGKLYNDKHHCFELIAQLANPSSTATIFDPLSAHGQTLVACIKHIEKHAQHTPAAYGVFGQEDDLRPWIYSRMVLHVQGFYNHLIYPDNTIDIPRFKHTDNSPQAFDVIVSHLGQKKLSFASAPYRLKVDSMQRFYQLGLPSHKAEYAYIFHALSCLNKQQGRAVLSIPQKILSRQGIDAQARKILLNTQTLEALICLPDIYNNKHNAEPLAIMILNHQHKQKVVNYIDGEAIFKHSLECLNTTNEAIQHTFHKPQTISRFSTLISHHQIQQNNYILSFSLYLNALNNNINLTDIHKIQQQRLHTEQALSSIKSTMDHLILQLTKNPEL